MASRRAIKLLKIKTRNKTVAREKKSTGINRSMRRQSMNDIMNKLKQPKRKTRKVLRQLPKKSTQQEKTEQTLLKDHPQQEQPQSQKEQLQSQQEQPQPQKLRMGSQNFYYSIPDSLKHTQLEFFEDESTKTHIKLEDALKNYGIILDTNREELKENLKDFKNKCGIFGEEDINGYFANNIVIFTRNPSDSQLTGVCFVNFVKSSRTIYISLICVPSYYTGVGSMIIQRLKTIAEENNLIIELVSILDKYVIKFYKKHGFTAETDISNIDEITDPFEMSYTPIVAKTIG